MQQGFKDHVLKVFAFMVLKEPSQGTLGFRIADQAQARDCLAHNLVVWMLCGQLFEKRHCGIVS